MSIEQLRKENLKLKETYGSFEQELQKLRQTGKAHEQEIDTLLKFNQRLLGIIENEFNSATKSRISSDLQIIAETNESTDLAANPRFQNRLGGALGKAGTQQYEQGYGDEEEEEEEEEIYNQEKRVNGGHGAGAGTSGAKPVVSPGKTARLDRVYQMQHKDVQISMNNDTGSNPSYTPTSSVRNPAVQQRNHLHKQSQPSSHLSSPSPDEQLQQLKQLVKQYRQQFVDNSAQYQQICVIIHNDLLNDFQEFNKLKEDSDQFYQEQLNAVNALSQEIKNYRPADQLVRVMKRLKVAPATEKLLQQRIVKKHK